MPSVRKEPPFCRQFHSSASDGRQKLDREALPVPTHVWRRADGSKKRRVLKPSVFFVTDFVQGSPPPSSVAYHVHWMDLEDCAARH